MTNSPKMECLENYIVKYIHIAGRANVFTDNHINFYLKSTTFFKDKLKNEILENRILLGDNFKKYLEFVSHRIKTETNFIIEEEVLENWRVSFNLQEIDFNAKSIADLKTSLHNLGIKLNLLDDEIISSKDRQSLYDIFEFHISSIEIIDFVDKYLLDIKIFTSKVDLPIYNENLQNDPLLNIENEYSILKSKFKEDHSLRTAHLKNDDDFFLHDFDIDFLDWEKTQNEEIKNTFLKIIRNLNENKIFFFGCSLDNYAHNYPKRLNAFLEYYSDASELDFIEDELQFLEHIYLDLQDTEAVHDGFSLSGYSAFKKAYEFVSLAGYKLYIFSHNKKEAFLNEKKFKIQQEQSVGNSQNNNNQSIEARKNSRVTIQTRENEENLDEKNANQKNLLQSTVEDENGFKIKVSSKYYALAYIIELLEQGSKPPQDIDGNFKKDEIIKIGRGRCNNSGQSFYNCVRDHFELVSSKKIKYSVFKNNWKKIVLNITNNNKKIASYIENNNL